MRLCDDFKFGYKLQHYFVYELILGDFGWYSQYIHKGEREREREGEASTDCPHNHRTTMSQIPPFEEYRELFKIVLRNITTRNETCFADLIKDRRTTVENIFLQCNFTIATNHHLLSDVLFVT